METSPDQSPESTPFGDFSIANSLIDSLLYEDSIAAMKQRQCDLFSAFENNDINKKEYIFQLEVLDFDISQAERAHGRSVDAINNEVGERRPRYRVLGRFLFKR